MSVVLDLISSALPWIGIGLCVAFSSVKILYLIIANMCDGNRSSGTTWLVLSAFYTIIDFGFL